MAESESDLLRRMLDGDEGAFTALYRPRQGAVYRFALQMTGCVFSFAINVPGARGLYRHRIGNAPVPGGFAEKGERPAVAHAILPVL
jgi:hypothetical protein